MAIYHAPYLEEGFGRRKACLGKNMFDELGSFIITKQQKARYKAGDLWHEWLEKYPGLFDEKDQESFRNQAVLGYGFVESLTAIFLYNATGYISVFGSFGYKSQPCKNALVEELVSKQTWEIITSMRKYRSQAPDLLCYAPDKSDYFFCEVKGPGDRLRETQVQYFQLLQEVSAKPVYTVKYKFAPFSR
jgi:hypothetical protein